MASGLTPVRSWFALTMVAACSSGHRAAIDAAAQDTGAEEDAAVADATPACSPACGPDQFCGLPSATCISRVVAVAAGSTHTCAVHRDGHLSCWGDGAFIAAGLPAITPPVTIDVGGPARMVTVGIQAACALLRDDTVSCWGRLGQTLETPGKVVKADGTPLADVKQIAGGSLAFCAVAPDGVYCWGENGNGELARPVSATFPPRTAVLALPRPVPLLTATVAIVVHDGASQLCGWGNNDSAILPGPEPLLDHPVCQEGVAEVFQLSAGDGHVCARRGGATFSCWGDNAGGQLGVGDENVLESPIPGTTVTLPADLDSIASGAYHACALLRTGKVMCWGNNDLGECGLRSSAPLFGPRALDDLDGVVAIGSGAGAQHTCAVMADGSVRCWGFDDNGQLGSGATSPDDNRYSPSALPVRW